jgi:predicted alpha/beta-hydrolase family hydrolase
MTRYPAAGSPLGALFVFAHGAGAGQRHPFMTGYATALAAAGVDVVTFDFPYMAQQRRLPDKPPVLEQSFRDAIAWAQGEFEGRRLFIGGKSMGGRIATHLAAQPEVTLRGVVALGYPLHPPGKPEQRRIAHLPSLRAPWLIVQGARDTFGTPSELEAELGVVPVPVTLHVLAGGDHSFGVKGRAPAVVRAEVIARITSWMDAL